MQRSVSRSLEIERLKSVARTIQENESIGPALLVGLASLIFFLSVPFYGLLPASILAIVCGAISYFRPFGGVALMQILGLFAIAHHSAGLAWLYAFVFLGTSIFELRINWKIYAYLILAISASFIQIPLGGAIVFIAFVFGCLELGSKKSLALSIPLIFFILLLSSLWNMPNNLAIPIGPENNFEPFEQNLMLQTQNPVGPQNILAATFEGLTSLFSFDGFTSFFAAIGKVVSNTIILLLSGPLFILASAFGIMGFAIGYLPIKLNEQRFLQALSSTPILLAGGAILLVSSIYGGQFEFILILYSIIAIGAVALLDFGAISISGEAAILASETQTKFGKFGEEKIQATNVSLDDIGGYDDVKAELVDAIAGPLQNKAVATAYGLKPASGVLLFGPPGTGKTLIMRALASELGLRFVSISCTDILSSWHGESEANVKEIFEKARSQAPCILFFDEIEGIAKSRDKFFGDDVGPRVLSVLLQQMDGFAKKSAKPVIIVGATNLPNQLDAAIMRPGRLDKIIYMHLPDAAARKKIFEVHTSKLPLCDEVDFSILVSKTDGYSGADIANIVSEAARMTARIARGKSKIVPVSQKHFLSVLKHIRPSTSKQKLAMYEKFGQEYERSTRSV